VSDYDDKKPAPARQCHFTIEKRYEGQRYVFSRDRCKNKTTHQSGYCWQHRGGRP